MTLAPRVLRAAMLLDAPEYRAVAKLLLAADRGEAVTLTPEEVVALTHLRDIEERGKDLPYLVRAEP